MPESATITLDRIAVELGEIRVLVANLESEVEKLRKWRHDLVNDFAGLRAMPGLLAGISTDLHEMRERVHRIDVRLAALDGERAERERLGVWARWVVPSGWLAALIAAAAAWWNAKQ